MRISFRHHHQHYPVACGCEIIRRARPMRERKGTGVCACLRVRERLDYHARARIERVPVCCIVRYDRTVHAHVCVCVCVCVCVTQSAARPPATPTAGKWQLVRDRPCAIPIPARCYAVWEISSQA
jgi:hypothetical protein